MLWRAFGIDIFTAAEWGDNFSTPETNKQTQKNQFSSSRQRQLASFVIVINKECIHFVDKQTDVLKQLYVLISHFGRMLTMQNDSIRYIIQK